MASPFCFRPSPELAARVDAAAERLGVSRAKFLSQAAEGWCERVENPLQWVPDEVRVERTGEPVKVSVAPPADGSARADAFRAMRRLGR